MSREQLDVREKIAGLVHGGMVRTLERILIGVWAVWALDRLLLIAHVDERARGPARSAMVVPRLGPWRPRGITFERAATAGSYGALVREDLFGLAAWEVWPPEIVCGGHGRSIRHGQAPSASVAMATADRVALELGYELAETPQ